MGGKESCRRMVVPGVGIEPTRLIQPRDFKSRASASSATRAFSAKIPENGRVRNEGGMEAAPGFEPGDKGFAVLCLTAWLCRRSRYSFPAPHSLSRYSDSAVLLLGDAG